MKLLLAYAAVTQLLLGLTCADESTDAIADVPVVQAGLFSVNGPGHGRRQEVLTDTSEAVSDVELPEAPPTYNFEESQLQWTISDCFNLRSDRPEFCAFTAQQFGNGRGISLLTTRSEAERLARQMEVIRAAEGKTLQVTPGSEHRFRSVDMPGKGRGWVAQQTIPVGSLIASETPVLVIDESIYGRGGSEYQSLLRIAVEALPQLGRDLFMDLYGQAGSDTYGGRVFANAFSADRLEDDDSETTTPTHAVIAPVTARLNHDCRPNTQYNFNWHTLQHSVYAVRTIYPGEELTITYTIATRPRAQRGAHLVRGWGFACSCALCQPGALSTASDTRLAELARIEQQLERTPDVAALAGNGTALAAALVSLYELERLDVLLGRAYAFAAFEHAGVGDRVRARMWAHKALAATTNYAGPHSAGLEELRAMVDDPASHWSWLIRFSQ